MKVSFTGTALISGTYEQLEQVKEKIKTRIPVEDVCHERNGQYTNLFGTNKEVPLLRSYLDAQSAIKLAERDTFYRQNIGKYVEIPDVRYTALQVLKAIAEDIFNFDELRIIA